MSHTKKLIINGNSVRLNAIGSSTYKSVQDLMNTAWSTGCISGGVVSDSGSTGSEKIDVAAATGVIRSSDSPVAALYNFDFAGSAGHDITTDTIRYVGMEYNSGTPQVVIKTTDTWNWNSEFPLGSVVNEGGTLFIKNNPLRAGNGIERIQHRIYEVDGLERANQLGGLILGEKGTRNVTVSAGELYDRLNEFVIDAIDTSGTDRFDLYYSDGGAGFTKVADQASWPNTQYDDGDGGLATLTANKYSNIWFWIETDGSLIAMYGTSNAVSAVAEAEAVPGSTPDRITEQAILIGRILFQKSAATATQVDTSFGSTFTPSQATDHVNLSNIGTNTHAEIDTHIGANNLDIALESKTINGNDFAIVPGYKGHITIPFSCTITSYEVEGDQSGSIQIDLWKCTYAQYDAGSTHPVDGDSITSSAPVTITTATKGQDATLTGWTKALGKGDKLGFNVDSIATIQRATITIFVTRT